MEPALNCTLLPQCPLDPTLDRLETLGLLQELCRTARARQGAPLSAAVQGVLGALLGCGFLSSFFFFIFTLRFRRNRIVKMSSPNLNLVIVLGSVVTYISAFMFAVQGPGVSMEAVIQLRLSLLYVGISLVFGPLLGKSWRLYRVFTHRVPDKRVIIKDISLLGLEAALLFVDTLLLASWVLSDPVICVFSVSAGIKAAERAVSCDVTRGHLCSSKYPDFWIAVLLGAKGLFLVFSSYLAGLTKNISSPPVNQSLVLMVGSSLVLVATVVVLLVSRYFYSWTSLVYGVTAGSILLCTSTTTCLIFIPQLLQWKQFEEEPSQSNVQMAKYFHSPCKSMRSMYSEEQIYHLLGENTSMRRLLTEKNAVIESLQEQVTNAKEKLVELLKSECSVEITQVSAISTSTLTINQHKVTLDDTAAFTESKQPPTADPDADTSHQKVVQGEDVTPPAEERSHFQEVVLPSPDSHPAAVTRNVSFADNVAKPHKEYLVDGPSDAWEQLSRKMNYVSCEKLQEILKELSVETLSGCSQASPRRQRRASHSAHRETLPHPPEAFHNVCLSLSPYITRRRRGPGYGRRVLHPSSQSSRAVFPPPRLVSARDRYNGANPLRDDTGDATVDEASPEGPHQTMKNAESCGQENGGLGITNSSEPQESPKGAGRVPRWNHAVMASLRPQILSSESDSSSSEETLCYCHRPYCEICSPPTCDSSDTETSDQLHVWPGLIGSMRPVINFTEDLTPTFV